MIPTLLLVAKRVHFWLEPMLYRNLSFHTLDKTASKPGPELALLRFLESAPSPMVSDVAPPRLSPELELHIFAGTASAQPSMVPTLLLVAKRVHFWLEPMLYRNLSFHTLDKTAAKPGPELALLRFLESGTRPPEFFANAVNNIYLLPQFFPPSRPDAWSIAELKKLLNACTGTQNLLVLVSTYPGDHVYWETVQTMRPRRLVLVIPASNEKIDFSGLPIFRGVERLMVVDTQSELERHVAGLLDGRRTGNLARLTHLALPAGSQTDVGLLQRLLAPPDSSSGFQLQMLLLQAPATWRIPDELKDLRIVVMHIDATNDWFWEVEDGRQGFWERAEKIMEDKSQIERIIDSVAAQLEARHSSM
uniref:Uncharacterized protein n=1 Tax=Mycena chlorophos TaxID=658473 RepID=A0ABQ0L5M8_MYCCL|nr:predicted protein [Mycena chlorophos]